MDMRKPGGPGPPADPDMTTRLEAVARVLGCPVEALFEPVSRPSSGETARLLQMWLAIRQPEDRQAVFACVRGILGAQPS